VLGTDQIDADEFDLIFKALSESTMRMRDGLGNPGRS